MSWRSRFDFLVKLVRILLRQLTENKFMDNFLFQGCAETRDLYSHDVFEGIIGRCCYSLDLAVDIKVRVEDYTNISDLSFGFQGEATEAK